MTYTTEIDLNINNWILDIDISIRNNIINNTLKLGYTIQHLINAQLNKNEIMEPIETEIKQSMNNMNNYIINTVNTTLSNYINKDTTVLQNELNNINENIKLKLNNIELNISNNINNINNRIIENVNDIKTLSTYINKDYNTFQNEFNNINNTLNTKINTMELNMSNNISNINGRIIENLTDIKTSLNNTFNNNTKSALKGAIGEQYIEQIITENFPDDILENTSKKTAEADYNLNNEILIEVKHYSSNIGAKEVDKFKRDLLLSTCNIGLFISITSGIIGHYRLSTEQFKDKIIIYVPNATKEAIIYGVLYAKQLKDKIHYNYYNTENIDNIYDDFIKLYDIFIKEKTFLIDIKNNIQCQLDALYKNIIENDVKIKSLIDIISQKLKIELLTSVVDNTHDEILKILNNIRIEYSNNEYELYYHLYELSIKYDINIKISSNNILLWIGISSTGKEIYKIKILTRRKDILLFNGTMTLLFDNNSINIIEKLL